MLSWQHSIIHPTHRRHRRYVCELGIFVFCANRSVLQAFRLKQLRLKHYENSVLEVEQLTVLLINTFRNTRLDPILCV